MIDPQSRCATLLEAFTRLSKHLAFICMDADGRVVGWNEGAAALFGYTQAEMLGRHLSPLFVAEEVAKGLERLELEAAARDGRSEGDRWHLRKDGSRLWIAGTVEALRDDTGELMGFVKMCRDRTDLRTRLEHLEQAAAESGDSVRKLGHELRDAIIPLNSAVALIRRIGPNARAETALDILADHGAVLGRVADELMSANRPGQGPMALQLEPTDLRGVAEKTVIGFEGLAQGKGVRLVTILPEGPLRAALDRPRFQQALVQLLRNAIDHTPPGGSVFIKGTQEGDEVMLRVEDTGTGIDPAVLPRIFELFTQARPLAHIKQSGLCIVKRLVEQHRGSVQARSAGAGLGAEFTVRLPALPPAL